MNYSLFVDFKNVYENLILDNTDDENITLGGEDPLRITIKDNSARYEFSIEVKKNG